MIRKDYLLKLLQQLDEALQKVHGKRGNGDHEEALQIIRQSYQRLLGLESEELSDLAYLTQEKKLEPDEMNALAELLTEEADTLMAIEQLKDAAEKYSLALDIFDYLNATEKIFSFEREAQMAHILKQLKSMD